jgi:hypothetical protein
MLSEQEVGDYSLPPPPKIDSSSYASLELSNRMNLLYSAAASVEP